ncbi:MULTISPECIES: cytochrome-c peroxidase [Myxococcaceae]|uniref:cytochrome-c peroxidase n=1 Tax=Myxococcaceae TaxID=31 RepID=UPI00129D1B49|nr:MULTISPECIES: cytochrome-c peroxidase [Myxococcaceae]MBF5042428.1 cytochrome-c peroxidase [Simulacricoccus sp. 17bor-14]
MSRALAALLGALLLACTGSAPSVPEQPPPPPEVPAAEPVPRPVSGGTLLVTHDGRYAVAADPDRDAVWVVDLAAWQVHAQLALQPGDEPGRLVEDEAGRVHVLLRRGGGVVALDVERGSVLSRRAVCPAPRGLTHGFGRLYVACAGGELVALLPEGGAPLSTLHLAADLRDVVFDGEQLWVSRFRSAELLRVDVNGQVAERVRPAALHPVGAPGSAAYVAFEPGVASRLVADPQGGLLLLHQLASTATLPLHATSGRPAYAGLEPLAGDPTCGDGVVHSALYQRSASGAAQGRDLQAALGVLPGDLAFSPAGDRVVAVAAGSRRVMVGSRAWLAGGRQGDCALSGERSFQLYAQPIAAAFSPAGTLLVQTREPVGLVRLLGTPEYQALTLGEHLAGDAGHRRFYEPAPSGISCASCHPEGTQDGRVWHLESLGARRTPPLGGGLAATAPFHWDGAVPDVASALKDTLVVRMGVPVPPAEDVTALSRWLETLPAEPAPLPLDAAAVARGEALFGSTQLGCNSCHAGARGVQAVSADIGTGGSFQAPPLEGLALRAPYLHDGCALSLQDVFGACAGGEVHGRVGALDAQAQADLRAYLESR